jgi:metal-responsive CopG/Arc/MetJ family transcriptional regulator
MRSAHEQKGAFMANVHRVNVNFSEDAYEELTELAQRKGKTLSDLLRDAIALERWFDDAKQEGSRVLVERDGKLREVIPR